MTTRVPRSARPIAVALAVAAALCAASAGAAAQDDDAGRRQAEDGRSHARGPAWLVARRAALVDAPAHARLAACRRSPRLDDRVAVVGAWMRPLDGATRLALRIDLYQRELGTRRWTRRADVPGLGEWTSPSDALVGTRAGDVFRYRQSVGRLAVPAAYRFKVAFRWFGADEAVIRETAVTTRGCRQPDLRPNLVVDEVRTMSSPRDERLVRYAVVVRNAGRAPAIGRIAVAATLPGDDVPGAHVRAAARRLWPGQRAIVAFAGPGCGAGEVPALFAVDPANAVDEADEGDNELAARCPAP